MSKAIPEKECFLLYLHQLWRLLKKRQVCLIIINHTNQCQRDSISLCLQNQNYGIWYMKPHDTKHPEISSAPFPLALYDGSFKRHTVFFLGDPQVRDRINPLIDATTDVFVTEVCYYHKCWLKCVTNRALTDEKMKFSWWFTNRCSTTINWYQWWSTCQKYRAGSVKNYQANTYNPCVDILGRSRILRLSFLLSSISGVTERSRQDSWRLQPKDD